MDAVREAAGRIAPVGLLALATLVFAGFPASMLFQAAGQLRPLTWIELVTCLGAGLMAVAALRWVGWPLLARPAMAGLGGQRRPSLQWALVVGLVARVIVASTIAPQPASDSSAYLQLAHGILEHGTFGGPDARAYWPPGMAFSLLPLLALASPAMASTLFGLACFAVAAVGLHRLAERLGLGAWAAWPVWLLALWPTHVLLTGLPEKELLVIALLPWVLWAALRALAQPAWGVFAGVLMGAIVLVQPSFQLLPFFAAGLVWLGGVPARKMLQVLVGVLLGAAIVVTPWTLRNLAMLGEPVLVSTNGGGNLYRANNALATGGYVAVGTVDVQALPELVANREGRRLAVEWIRQHPLDFLQLTAGRILLFPGDHSYGAYAAFRADPERIPRGLYLALKAATAGTWLLLWGVIAAVAWRALKQRRGVPAGASWLLLPWLYLAGIHAFFESGSKYHLPTLGCVLLLTVLLLKRDDAPPAIHP